MKTISITSIVCGTLLILAPVVHDMFLTSQIAHLLETTREHVSISGTLSPSYNPWCMFIGVCAIVSGLILAVRFRSTMETSHSAPPLPNAVSSNA